VTQVCYYFTIKPPKKVQCVAELKELDLLREHFGIRRGQNFYYINPNYRSPVYIPRILFGIHQLRMLWRREKQFDLHHLYNPDAFPYPILRWLRKPIVYTISGGYGQEKINPIFWNRLGSVVVADRQSAKKLQAAGIRKVDIIPPWVDSERFTITKQSLTTASSKKFRLMMASGPWTHAQFQTKGIIALLEAAQQNKQLELIFLWRGVLYEAMESLVKSYGVASQVTVIDRVVDVNQMLASVHATVALVSSPGIMRAYPHSLLDSMAAGKPVLVSRALPMSEYVTEKGVGIVVDEVNAKAIQEGVEQMCSQYPLLQAAAEHYGRHDFSKNAMLTAHHELYERVKE